MPPRKFKVDHHRGGGGKHVSSFEEVKARNAGEESAYDKARRERQVQRKQAEEEDRGKLGSSSSSGSESEREEKGKASAPAKRTGIAGLEVENPNHVKRNEEKEGVELTRKQREELDKAAARRRYEELHKAGKTDEAKADLARLEEVKKRREEAAQKKAAEEAKAKEKEVANKGIDRTAVIDEIKAMTGVEAARMRGDRSSKKKEEEKSKKEKGDTKDGESEASGSKKKIINGVEEDAVYSSYASTVATKKEDKPKAERPMAGPKVNDGSIEACRAAEADFM